MLYHNIKNKSSGIQYIQKIEKLRFKIRLIESEGELKNQHNPESIYKKNNILRFREKTVDNKKVGDGVTDFLMWFLKLYVTLFQLFVVYCNEL